MAVCSVPKLGIKLLKFLKPIWTVCDCVRAVWGVCFIIYEINCVLVSRRPEMGMEFGSTKSNRRLVSGLPTDSHCSVFRTVKNSPGFVGIVTRE